MGKIRITCMPFGHELLCRRFRTYISSDAEFYGLLGAALLIFQRCCPALRLPCRRLHPSHTKQHCQTIIYKRTHVTHVGRKIPRGNTQTYNFGNSLTILWQLFDVLAISVLLLIRSQKKIATAQLECVLVVTILKPELDGV